MCVYIYIYIYIYILRNVSQSRACAAVLALRVTPRIGCLPELLEFFSDWCMYDVCSHTVYIYIYRLWSMSIYTIGPFLLAEPNALLTGPTREGLNFINYPPRPLGMARMTSTDLVYVILMISYHIILYSYIIIHTIVHIMIYVIVYIIHYVMLCYVMLCYVMLYIYIHTHTHAITVYNIIQPTSILYYIIL